jgi:hypothetical protein
VTLIDFGMCETTSDGTSIKPAGTFHAMSPEMIELFLKSMGKEKLEQVGFEHDYYTLGVLLLEFIMPDKIMYFTATDLETSEGMLRLKVY